MKLPMAHSPERCSDLRPALDQLYESFNTPGSAADPIQIVRRFDRPDDREVVGFCAAALASPRGADSSGEGIGNPAAGFVRDASGDDVNGHGCTQMNTDVRSFVLGFVSFPRDSERKVNG